MHLLYSSIHLLDASVEKTGNCTQEVKSTANYILQRDNTNIPATGLTYSK